MAMVDTLSFKGFTASAFFDETYLDYSRLRCHAHVRGRWTQVSLRRLATERDREPIYGCAV